MFRGNHSKHGRHWTCRSFPVAGSQDVPRQNRVACGACSGPSRSMHPVTVHRSAEDAARQEQTISAPRYAAETDLHGAAPQSWLKRSEWQDELLHANIGSCPHSTSLKRLRTQEQCARESALQWAILLSQTTVPFSIPVAPRLAMRMIAVSKKDQLPPVPRLAQTEDKRDAAGLLRRARNRIHQPATERATARVNEPLEVQIFHLIQRDLGVFKLNLRVTQFRLYHFVSWPVFHDVLSRCTCADFL